MLRRHWPLSHCFFPHPIGAAESVLRVTPNGAPLEANRDGSSWERALGEKEFSAALSSAGAGTEFWVAGGIYRPSLSGDPAAAFILGDGVAVYGGFKGDEKDRSGWDPKAHVTILSTSNPACFNKRRPRQRISGLGPVLINASTGKSSIF